MRILQVITGLGTGGAERALLQLVRAIDREKFEIKIATLANELGALSSYGYSDVDVAVFDLSTKRPRAILAFARMIDEFRPDVIHAHMFHSLLAVIMARSLSKVRPPICFTGHRTVHAPGRRFLLNLFKHARAADIIFSQEGSSSANARNTVIIPNGIDVIDPAPPREPWQINEPKRLITVGRLVEVKDCLGLVRSFAAANLENTELLFAGAGPLEHDIARLADTLGIANQVKLLGFSSDVRALLRTASVFVMHSRQEGLPMALLEAGAEGLPVIATPVGSIPSLLGNDRGLLASPPDFPKTLRRIVSSPVEALAMGRRLQAHIASHYSITLVAAAHQRLYTTLSSSKQ